MLRQQAMMNATMPVMVIRPRRTSSGVNEKSCILIFVKFFLWLRFMVAVILFCGCKVTFIISNSTFLFVSIHYKMGISSLHFFVSSLHLDVRNITNCTRRVMKNVRNAQKMPISSVEIGISYYSCLHGSAGVLARHHCGRGRPRSHSWLQRYK